jgi:uncharacterized protein involved in high-affinity Fe2+ transport
MKKGREKGENVKKKKERGKKKRKREVKEFSKLKIGKNIDKKSTIGVKKTNVSQEGKYLFRRGMGIITVFGPKFRPLA